MQKIPFIKIILISLTWIAVLINARADIENDANWLNSNRSKIRPSETSDSPILYSKKSKYLNPNKKKEEDIFLSQEDIAKLQQASLVNKYFYNNPDKKYFPRIELSVKFGYPRHILRPMMLLPLTQTQTNLTFFNMMVMADTNPNFEVNSAMGHRHLYNDFILGGYIFYDFRITNNSNRIHNFTIGFEYLRQDMDARFNIYIPTTTKHPLSQQQFAIVNNSGPSTIIESYLRNQYEVVRLGIDAEIGGLITPDSRFSIYGKPFLFFHNDFKNIYGGTIRGAYALNAYIDFNLELTYDTKRSFAFYGGLKFKWSFDNKNMPFTLLEDKMTQMPARDVDAVTTIDEQPYFLETVKCQGKAALIDKTKNSIGAFSSIAELNASSEKISDIYILDGQKVLGLATMSNQQLEHIELSSLVTERVDLNPNSCLNKIIFGKDSRPETIKLFERIDREKHIQQMKDNLLKDFNAELANNRKTLLEFINKLQASLPKTI